MELGLSLRYNYKKIFVRYIKEICAYKKYKDNCNPTPFFMRHFKEGSLNIYTYVSYPFFWDDTQEGISFWESIHEGWLNIVEQLQRNDLNELKINKLIQYEIQHIRRKM